MTLPAVRFVSGGWRVTSKVMAVAVALLGIVLSSCGGASGPSITLYSGQHPQLTSQLVAAFERRTGISVRVLTNDGVVLADQILEEGRVSPADVFLTENSPELMLLQEHGLLARLPTAILGQVPPADSSPAGDWVGVAVRVNVLAYDPSQVHPGQLPSSVMDLAGPTWAGKIGIAPTDSDFLPLVGAIAARYGRARALSWLEGLKKNAVLFQNDEAVTAAVNRGSVASGLVNQYYWYRLRLELGRDAMHSALYSFPSGDVGSLANLSGAGILASSPKQADARRFVAFLVSPQGQQIVARGDDFEYPVRPGVIPNPILPPLSTLHPTTIGVVRLGDDREASSLLQQAGLA